MAGIIISTTDMNLMFWKMETVLDNVMADGFNALSGGIIYQFIAK